MNYSLILGDGTELNDKNFPLYGAPAPNKPGMCIIFINGYVFFRVFIHPEILFVNASVRLYLLDQQLKSVHICSVLSFYYLEK